MSLKLKRNATVQQYCQMNDAFLQDAYYFVQHAVALSPRFVGIARMNRHITGQELLDIIRKLLLKHYGPFAIDVLDHWGVHTTLDFGKIVYSLVEMKLLSVDVNDSISDFDNVYDFTTAFVLPFRE